MSKKKIKGCQGRGQCECRDAYEYTYWSPAQDWMCVKDEEAPKGEAPHPPMHTSSPYIDPDPLGVNGGSAALLTFDTGATRNRKENELAYEGFLHPLVLQHYAKYMHKHRVQADGSTRAPDNWQKGMPDESYLDSLLRHIMDLWLIHRGYEEDAREGEGDALAACIFNIQGLTLNYLRALRGEEAR